MGGDTQPRGPPRPCNSTETIEEAIQRVKRAFDPSLFRWEGIEARAYKDAPGTARGMAWQGVSRNTLARGSFEIRYFELAPGGFSSLERHAHVHAVVCVRGRGRALLGERVVSLAPFDFAETAAWEPHRWMAWDDEPFGFLCTVDGERDEPHPLSDEEWDALLANPSTAPFVF